MSDFWKMVGLFIILLFLAFIDIWVKMIEEKKNSSKRKGVYKGSLNVSSRSDPKGYTIEFVAHVREEEKIGKFSRLTVLSSNHPEADYSHFNLIESNRIEWQEQEK